MSNLSPQYSLSVDRFHEAAKASGFILKSYELAGWKGPHGESLSCDIALRKHTDASTVLVTTSAIHGVEHLGGALQAAWMKEAQDIYGTQKIDLLHVHALNPFGFAHDRRADHENIDVNRNFLQAFDINHNPRYARYADAIVPKKDDLLTHISGQFRIAVAAKLWPGAAVMKDILTHGQTIDPLGMYFGGHKPSWSRSVWTDIIREHLQHYERVLHLDVHTGLGAPGELQVFPSGQVKTEALDFARHIWGPFVTVQPRAVEADLKGSSFIYGDITDFWDVLSTHKPSRADTYALEFGTVEPMQVFMALRADHALYAQGITDKAKLDKARLMMRAAFAPEDEAWLAQVMAKGRQAYQAAYAGLAAELAQSPK